MPGQAAPGLVTERPQSLDTLLTVEVQFGGVLQVQDPPPLAPAVEGAFQVRRQEVFPLESLFLLAGLIEKAVSGLRLQPARTGARNSVGLFHTQRHKPKNHEESRQGVGGEGNGHGFRQAGV
jgi:hypothetical protein